MTTDARAAGPPSVSVVIPVLNDAEALPAAVAAALAQEYAGVLDVCIAVGPSRDGTESVAQGLAADSRVRVVANPAGVTAAGLNAAIAGSTGEIVVRVDGRSVLPPGYVARVVERLATTGAHNVGGVMDAEGRNPVQRAVAAAMTSRFGTGDARFHTGGPEGPVDTVYLGAFPRAVLDRLGGYDETLRVVEDGELNWRIRASGGTVWFDPTLRVRYSPRASVPALARQYLTYGRWKREMIRRHPQSRRWRQTVAPTAVVANAVGIFGGLLVDPRLLAIPATYVAATVLAAVVAGRRSGPVVVALLPVVFAVMHHAWGIGYLIGPERTPHS